MGGRSSLRDGEASAVSRIETVGLISGGSDGEVGAAGDCEGGGNEGEESEERVHVDSDSG